MQKYYRVIMMSVILLFIAMTTTGCNTYYSLQGGKLIKCGDDWSGNTGCGTYYQTSDGQNFEKCTHSWGNINLNCSPVPPPVSPSPTSSGGCVPKYVYDNLINKGQSWVVVSQQQDQNSSPSPVQATFTATTSKTVTVTDRLDVIASLNATAAAEAGILVGLITANVKTEIDHEVTQTVNTTIGNALNFPVPPGETAYANYGVKVQITSGHLYDKAKCEGNKSNWGTDVTYVPIAAGWCVWLSNQPACPSL